ncbi:MAG: hypothetical protein HY601_00910 [Candidatus Omnitrophica bacterium]|nr:hypothetical protein [Candidatus Omnitrophota bacterium]
MERRTMRHEGVPRDTKPRFPREWLDAGPGEEARVPPVMVRPAVSFAGEAPAHAPKPRAMRRLRVPLLAAVLVMGLGLGGALHALWQEYRWTGPASGAMTHRVMVEGMIEDLGSDPDGRPTVTVVDVAGRPSRAGYSFGGTSVFQQAGVLTVAHLKVGQEVNLVHEKGVAKTIEILHQPVPCLPH